MEIGLAGAERLARKIQERPWIQSRAEIGPADLGVVLDVERREIGFLERFRKENLVSDVFRVSWLYPIQPGEF